MITPKIDSSIPRGRGRPREFDRAAAVDRAMRLFWENGYEGTSFDALVAEMGISASSFYNAFGSKERLYKEATDAYLSASSKWFAGALSGHADARSAFEHLMSATASEFTRHDLPAGCMVSLAGTHVPASLKPVRDMMVGHRATAEAGMAARLRQGVADGDLPAETNVATLAAYFNAMARGMAVQARDGASREQLLEVGQLAMQAWPKRAPGAPGDTCSG